MENTLLVKVSYTGAVNIGDALNGIVDEKTIFVSKGEKQINSGFVEYLIEPVWLSKFLNLVSGIVTYFHCNINLEIKNVHIE